jgi:hypothetical protein
VAGKQESSPAKSNAYVAEEGLRNAHGRAGGTSAPTASTICRAAHAAHGCAVTLMCSRRRRSSDTERPLDEAAEFFDAEAREGKCRIARGANKKMGSRVCHNGRRAV